MYQSISHWMCSSYYITEFKQLLRCWFGIWKEGNWLKCWLLTSAILPWSNQDDSATTNVSSLAPGRCGDNLKSVTFQHMLQEVLMNLTHLATVNWLNIGSDNDLSLGQWQAIIPNNAGILLIEPSATNCSQISIAIHKSSLKKMHLKMLSAK